MRANDKSVLNKFIVKKRHLQFRQMPIQYNEMILAELIAARASTLEFNTISLNESPLSHG